MDISRAYNSWAEQYDSNINKTRDLEALCIKNILSDVQFDSCLEIGCGTGKNTEWLLTKAKEIVAIDLSESMLSIAKAKIKSDKVTFLQTDFLRSSNRLIGKFNLLVFSLILEHVENLELAFDVAASFVAPGGHVYIGELHPYKQYSGTKARFETSEGMNVVTCFNHHTSDFTSAAKNHGFEIVVLKEFFDDNDHDTLPRILTILFKKTD